MSEPRPNCRHCGKPLRLPEAKYCTHCGAPLKGSETVHGGSRAKVIIHLSGEETLEEFLTKASVTIGRRNSNMIQILSPIVSGEHARIDLTRKGHTIIDLDSTNGTFLNGQQLRAYRPYLLTSNDIIRFSDSLGNSAKLTYIAPSMYGDVSPTEITRTFQLTDTLSFIGRNPDAAITLNHPAVSWNHAKVTQEPDKQYIIEDLSSNNGSFVNGNQLRRVRRLARGDVVQIGPFNLIHQGQGKFITFSAERNFRLEAVNLFKQVYQKDWRGLPDTDKPRPVLSNLNLVINPREFVAVVGGSGTGKSTLLKALSGISPATSGTVLVNGDNLYDNFNLYRAMIGYVPQDDIIHDGLRVRDALYYAAALRLPDATRSEIHHRIEEVLHKVSMTAEANTMIRDLSGGQRKRVNIAVELLAEPWIFFLDEPTSGLDPGLEKLMMDTLRQLADEGRTIVLVTHATENLAQNCDHVAFLAQGGQLTFFGPPDQALKFFNVGDFSDIYTRLIQRYNPAENPKLPREIVTEYSNSQHRHPTTMPIPAGPLWAERYHNSLLYETYVTNRQTGEVARYIHDYVTSKTGGILAQLEQFNILTRRYLDLIRQDFVSLSVLLLLMPSIGLILLLISNPVALVGNSMAEIQTILETTGRYNIISQAESLLFMMALAATMLGVFTASFEIIKERAIYQRERIVNMRIGPYFASKFIVLTTFSLIQCLLLLLVLAIRIDYPTVGALMWLPLEYYLTLVLTATASVALGLFISAVSASRNMVIYLLLLVLFAQIVFSGVVFDLSTVSEPVSYLTITRWSMEALAASTDLEALNNLGQIRVEREIDLGGRGIQRLTEDVQTNVTFGINYSYGLVALFIRWVGLLLHGLTWSGLTMLILRWRDPS